MLRTPKDPLRRMSDDSVDNGDAKQSVPLERLDVMRSRPNQSLENAHGMCAGPDLDSRAGKRLKSVCGRRSIVHALRSRFGPFNFQRCRDAYVRPPAVEGRTLLRSISGSHLLTVLQRSTVRRLIPGTEKRAVQVLDNVAAYASATYQVVSTWNRTPVRNIYVAYIVACTIPP